MTLNEPGESNKPPERKSQFLLMVAALGLIAAAGAWAVAQRRAWKEFYREWTRETRDVAHLDREFKSLGSGVFEGVTPGGVTSYAKPTPLAPDAVTSDWTQFLGPSNDCTSPETPLAKEWPDGGPMLLWARNSGPTYATPAVKGDRLIHFARYGDEEVVTCANAETGETIWEYPYPTSYEDNYAYGTGPKCAPIIDGDRVYTYGVEGRLHCFNLQTGELIWKRSPMEEYHLQKNPFGVGDAPLVEGDLLIVTAGVPDGPCVVAYNKLTGETVWGVGDQWRAAYSSPVAATVHGERRVFAFTGGESNPPVGGLMVVDPAKGEEVFRFPFRSRDYLSTVAASPVVVEDQVFLSGSYRLGGALLKINPDGSYEERWRTAELASHWMTPVYKDGYLYGFDGRYENDATLVCLEWATGKLVWRKLIEWSDPYLQGGQTQPGNFTPGRASLLSVDGQFLCLGEFGHLLWLDLTPEDCKVMSRAWIVEARNVWGIPVVSHGLLYVNQSEVTFRLTPPRLLCFDLRGKTDQ